MRLSRRTSVDRPPSAVFDLISDPDRYPEFFVGITRWEPASSKRRGVGARFRARMKVGSIEAGGMVRVTEWQRDRRIAWTSERGIPQRGGWRLRKRDGGTELTLEIEADLSGGPVGRVVDLVVGRIVGRNMAATLAAARRILEDEAPAHR